MPSLRAVVVVCALAQSAMPMAAAIELTPVAEGVYAVLQEPSRRINDANNAVIVTDRDVIVVDTSIDPRRTREVIAAISELTDLPVSHLIDTHWHLDHTHGNQAWIEVFPGIEIVGHPVLAEIVPGRAVDERRGEIEAYREAIPRVEGWVESGRDGEGKDLSQAEIVDYRARLERARDRLEMLETIRPVPPTLLVNDSLVVRRDSGDVVILALAGHTEGDLVVHLPRQKVLVAGDLIDEVPFAGHGDPRVWLESLEALAALEIDRVIPGHGPVMEGQQQIERLRRFFGRAVREIGQRSRDGRCPEELASEIDPAPFRAILEPADEVASRAFEGMFGSLVERLCELQRPASGAGGSDVQAGTRDPERSEPSPSGGPGKGYESR